MSTAAPSPVRAARALRKGGDAAGALAALVDAVRRDQLDPMALEAAGRLITTMVDADELQAPATRVHLLGQTTTSWLMSALVSTSYGRGLPLRVTEGGFDQVFQELLALSPGEVDVLVLLPWTSRLLGGAGAAAERIADEVAFWSQVHQRAAALGCKIVQVGWDLPGDGPLGVALGGAPEGPLGCVRAANEALRRALPPGACFVDLARVTARLGAATWDARNWFWTKQPFSEAGLVELASAVQAAVRAVVTGPKKVLVLDLDNTLWGGVVGELGPLGVVLGETPEGEAYRAFQTWCKALAARGVVLAVASKNEPDDARGPFQHNPAMVLSLADIAAFEANWGPKSESIRRIAADLNLGLDSFVFVDDNPAEREQVRQALPEVEVVELPADVFGYVAAVERGRWFEAVGLTAEDAARTRQYVQERERRDLAAHADSLEGYLTSLEMVADVRPIDEADLPRVVQLLGKTNQFNVTTRRHGPDVVRRLVQAPGSACFTLRLADRFGDHGLVAVVLAAPAAPGILEVDTLLMSCRVIARTAEEFLFAHLLDLARAAGHAVLRATYLPTKKNRQVADLFDRFGLRRVGGVDGEPEGVRYEAPLAELSPPATFVRLGGDR